VQDSQRGTEVLPGGKPAFLNNFHQQKGPFTIHTPGQRPGNPGSPVPHRPQGQKAFSFRGKHRDKIAPVLLEKNLYSLSQCENGSNVDIPAGNGPPRFNTGTRPEDQPQSGFKGNSILYHGE